RLLTAVGPPMREETIVFERPSRFSYKVLSGLPVRDHVGTASLEPSGEGTRVTYAVRTTPTLPVVGGAVVAGVKLAIGQLLDGVTVEAERQAAAPATTAT
ncbi:MAG TPA: SRPBCC family protein, partial [Solirubrobacterales bacterium]|nr:SRPBCC family protein [Solirubrobacterales bacterium]